MLNHQNQLNFSYFKTEEASLENIHTHTLSNRRLNYQFFFFCFRSIINTHSKHTLKLTDIFVTVSIIRINLY